MENSPALTSRGLGRVLGDLAALGYDAKWGVISAADTGAPHLRERIWIVADLMSGRLQGAEQEPGQIRPESYAGIRTQFTYKNRWPSDAGMVRIANPGMANRVDRIKALGNGQVPRVCSTAWRILSDEN